MITLNREAELIAAGYVLISRCTDNSPIMQFDFHDGVVHVIWGDESNDYYYAEHKGKPEQLASHKDALEYIKFGLRII